MATTADLFPLPPNGGRVGNLETGAPIARDGADLVFFTNPLSEKLEELEKAMLAVTKDANMSDQKMAVTMQQLAGAWSVMAMTQTQVINAIKDSLLKVAQNVG